MITVAAPSKSASLISLSAAPASSAPLSRMACAGPTAAAPPAAAPLALPIFTAGRSAAQVDRCLRQSLALADRAQECAALWFADIARRALYRDLGFPSLELYATQALGFSRNRFFQFQHLAADLERLPRLKAAVAEGRLGWTKAQQVARVATPESEAAWVAKAATLGRRDFAATVSAVRAKSRARRKSAAQAAQLPLADPAASAGAAPAKREAPADTAVAAEPFEDPPTTIGLRLDGRQLAQF